jgi:histidinol dehydrogenase
MIKMVSYRGEPAEALISRAEAEKADVQAVVSGILAEVKLRGDEAVLDFCHRFDGVRPERLLVTESELDAAFAAMDPALIATMQIAAENIERFHARQKQSGFMDTPREGVVLGQRVLPLRRVGLYVPGGTARYPSSVLMNAIPARLAGVSEIVMTTPPDKDGNVPPVILAAAKLAGVKTIVKLGGAQAIAALAYGTGSVPKVDKVVGPGNAYVAAAKQLCYGQGLIDIDMVAGPSEILIMADGKSDPAHVAADLLSQAEHDALAAAWLLTDSQELGTAVQAELQRQLPLLEREAIARASIENYGRILLVNSMEAAAALANEIAPEHLEICTDDPFGLLPLLTNAGSVCLGRYAPEPLGDYLAGPNHTLPTGGTARYASPLGVEDFIKRSSYIYYTQEAFDRVAGDVRRFALHEGLTAHANAVAVRMREGQA